MKILSIKAAISLLLILLAACTAKTSPEEAISRQAKEAGPQIPVPASVQEKKSWEAGWEKTLAAARKEGKVVVYSVRGSELVVALREALLKKYGIQLEHITGQGPSLHQKIVAEYKAGVTGCDVYLPGTTGLINTLKPAGAVDPIDPELIFPEITDPEQIKKVWLGGALDWIDRDHTGLGFLSSPTLSLAINTELVNPEEIKSYRDLLNPKWQGKIIMDDPTQAGSGQKWAGVTGGVIMGWDFIEDLVKQKPMISREHRLMADWLAHGKYAISIGILTDAIKEFQKAGAPLKFLTLKEGTYRGSSGSIIVLPKGRPHPDAARVFINWTLSAEAGAIWTKYYYPSNRLDIDKKGIDPLQNFVPGVQYFNSDTEDWTMKAPEHMAKAREIFAPLLR